MPKAACDQSRERLIQELILTYGLITMTDTWKIPAPVRQTDGSDGATRKETINLRASF